MSISLFQDMALAEDLPEYRLRRGDLVRPVEFHSGLDGNAGYSVEVLGALGQVLGVVAVSAAILEPLRADEVLSVRAFGKA